MKKRILSAILAICLLLSVVPMVSAEDMPTLTPVKSQNRNKCLVGHPYTLTYVRDDCNLRLAETELIFEANLTGKETDAQLNEMAADLLWNDAEAVYVRHSGGASWGKVETHTTFDCEELPVGTYLFVIVFAVDEVNEEGHPVFTIFPDTAMGVGVTIYDPNAPVVDPGAHTHDWELTSTSPVWPRMLDVYNVYTCRICGEHKSETVHNCTTTAYKDVPAESNWAHSGIDYCVKNGLMNGISPTQFDPKGVTTRAQFVTILWRQAGSPKPAGKTPFVDVKAGSYYADAVAWAYEKGVVNGMDATHFDPNAPLNREMLATLLYRYTTEILGMDLSIYVNLADLSGYPDVGSVSKYAEYAMRWANQRRLISGVAENGVDYLRPQTKATREQTATLIARYMDWLAM